jgi:phospholipid/cholesterol/gamma-HCH transport system substrate-binding protein
MAAESRGLQHVRPKAGTFVLSALLVATIGIFLGGRAQGWFEPSAIYRASVVVPADTTLGLEPGAEVVILGNTVGAITRLAYSEGASGPAADQVKLTFEFVVRGPMLKLVRADSKIWIKRKFGVAGSPFAQIVPGRGEAAPVGATLACELAPDIAVLLENTLDNFNRPDSSLQRTLANVEGITKQVLTGKGVAGRMIGDDAAGQSLADSLANLQKLTAALTSGEGMVGKLLYDPQGGKQLTSSMDSINQSLDNVNKLLAKANNADITPFLDQLKHTLEQVDGALKEVTLTTAALRQQSKELPGVIAQTQEMMRQTTRMIEGVQKTWLLRDYVNPEGSTRLSPADVTAP